MLDYDRCRGAGAVAARNAAAAQSLRPARPGTVVSGPELRPADVELARATDAPHSGCTSPRNERRRIPGRSAGHSPTSGS